MFNLNLCGGLQLFFLHIIFCQSVSNSQNAQHDDSSPFSTDVTSEVDGLTKTMKNFETRVGLAKDLETMSSVCCLTNKITNKIVDCEWNECIDFASALD